MISMWSNATPIPDCHYCGVYLDSLYDYSCISCGRETCDNDSQACQEEGCDEITCFACVVAHLQAYHTDTMEFV